MIGLRALARGDALPPVKADVMRMYNMRFCPFAQRTRMVLLYKNIPHEVVNVNLRHKPAWLLQRNPFGLVPILELKGQIVYESSVCDDYLEEEYPDPPLYPKDPMQRARCRVIMAKYDKMLPSFYKMLKPNAEVRSKASETIRKELNSLEIELGGKAFFAGSQLGMVDLHVYPWFERLSAVKSLTGVDFLGERSLHHLQDWQKRMEEFACVRETMQPAELHFEFITGLANRTPDYDLGLPLKSKM